MTEIGILKLVGVTIVNILSGILTVLAVMNWIFPTKNQVMAQCTACREKLYAKLDTKANCTDMQHMESKMDTNMQRLEGKMDTIASNVTTIGNNVAELTGVIKERYKG